MDGTSIILENFPVIRQCAPSPHNPLMQIGKDTRNTLSFWICKRWSEIFTGLEVVMFSDEYWINISVFRDFFKL